MNASEALELLRDVESERSERTTSRRDTDKFGQAICAFANDLAGSGRPGYLFVGADKDGNSDGGLIDDQLLQNLAAIRADGNLLPPPSLNVSKLETPTGPVAAVEVLPSPLPPVRYRGTVWVRVGPRRAIASEADERRLMERRASLALSWDARACAESTLDDLDLGLFEAYRRFALSREVIEENHRSFEHQLESLRLCARGGRPTHAGILALGKNPRFFVPSAYVQYVRYRGADPGADISAERRIDGDLYGVLRSLNSLADDLCSPRLLELLTLQEKTAFDYPKAALHEVFANAVIHRDYEDSAGVLIQHFDDRLEVWNPGGLFGGMAAEEFPRVAYRNPILAEVAKTFGFVNRFGRGVHRTQAAMKENGSAAAQFQPSKNHFLVVLPKRP
ncbi:MAG: putative DNA binding domain-containing protein [Planctomycetes bacterium]|nr:putative DNA binding domain-containing protein [Planctomycetota bacterium]